MAGLTLCVCCIWKLAALLLMCVIDVLLQLQVLGHSRAEFLDSCSLLHNFVAFQSHCGLSFAELEKMWVAVS